MTFGIAIPTYIGHIQHLDLLLDTLQNSTVAPDVVSIACSGVNEPILIDDKYKFSISLSTTVDNKNAAQNRNIAASNLNTDIISFIDGDDLVHPQRIEFIKNVFINSNIQAVVHDYELSYNISLIDFLQTKYTTVDLYVNCVDDINTSTVYPTSSVFGELSFHNAHISIRNSIFQKYKFNEDSSFARIEDSIYTRDLVTDNIKLSYIKNKLSYYVK